MNSIVSGAAIEPIMQRMSSVDHDGSVSSNDESSRDRDDDDDEEEEDPSEKPDEVVDVELAAVSPVTVSPVVVEVASPMVVEEEEEDDEEDVNDEDEEDEQEEEESSESDRDSQAISVNDVTRSSASSDNNNSGISATTMSAVDQSTDAESVLERSRAEIASLSSAMFGYTPRSINFDGDDDSQSPTRTSSQVVARVGVTSTATDASLPTPNARPAAVVGSVSRMDSVAASSPRRFSPYPRRTTNAVPSATTTRSDIITSVNEILRMYSGGNGSGSASPANVTSSRRATGVVQQQQQQVRSPPALATSGNSQPRTQQSSSTTSSSSSSVVTAGTMPRMAIPSGTILSGGARRTSQQQQQQPPNVPQNHQVIRSAIVGNRTIITTKTPSKFPFSADLQQAGAAILGDRYILLDLCDGTSLYKCIDVKTKEEFVCKVSGVE